MLSFKVTFKYPKYEQTIWSLIHNSDSKTDLRNKFVHVLLLFFLSPQVQQHYLMGSYAHDVTSIEGLPI